MTLRWYMSVYDRNSEELVLERVLHDVTDDLVRSTFRAAPDAVGGFPVSHEHLAFLARHTGADLDLHGQVAFVELLEDGNA